MARGWTAPAVTAHGAQCMPRREHDQCGQALPIYSAVPEQRSRWKGSSGVLHGCARAALSLDGV
eukprot:5026043-Alexandrium_andersonii.AAC.1